MGDGVDGGALSGGEGRGSGVWRGVSAVLAVFGIGNCAVGGALVGVREGDPRPGGGEVCEVCLSIPGIVPCLLCTDRA